MNDELAFLFAIRTHPEEDTPRLVYADWLQEHDQEPKAQALRHGVVKRFGVDFDSPGGALTLSPGDVDESHASGWAIKGEVHEDYYTWVNDFEASHPTHGLLWGDFEDLVFASSEEGFAHFMAHHEPSAWDYHDI